MVLMEKGWKTLVWNISVDYFEHITIISKIFFLLVVRIQTPPLIVYLFGVLVTL